MDQVHAGDGLGPLRAQPGAPLFVGRQGIIDVDGRVHGYEFLYRSARGDSLRVDLWPSGAQDRATSRVLQAVCTPMGLHAVAADARVFVNFTRSFLVGDLPVPDEPERLVVEVVESVRTDEAVLAGIRDLRERGFRIAIDDFIGLSTQVELLPLADYVKVDCRDLIEHGPALAALAASSGARLVAEHVETHEELELCRDLGFGLFQGFLLDETLVFDRTQVPTTRTARPTLRILDAARPREPMDSSQPPAHAAAL